MGTALTGTEIKDTYDSLIKITDNGPISGTLKTLTDGLGNDSALALSTGAASVTGTLTTSSLIRSNAAGAGFRHFYNNGSALAEVSQRSDNKLQLYAYTGSAYTDILLGVDGSAVGGKVGIGTNNPAGQLHISGDGAAANLIRLQHTGAGTNGFFDISVTSTEAQLNANYSTTAIPMTFLTGAAERMRITSAGYVGIGTSLPSALVEANGAIRTTRAGVASQYIEIDGGDAAGGFITNTGVGKILTIRNSSTSSSAIFFDQTVASEYAFKQAGTQILRIDADGVKFGADSAAANALDDYEEGTFTISLNTGTSGTITLNSSYNIWTYTKIGRQVTINGVAVISAVSSPVGTYVYLSGLPFTIQNYTGAYGAVNVTFVDSSPFNRSVPPAWHTINDTRLDIEIDASTIASGDEFYVTATYFV